MLALKYLLITFGFGLFAVALALTEPVFLRVGKNQTSQKMRSVLAYVGAYSSPQGPEGSIGHGQGIYLFEMNPATGALYQRAVFPSDFNSSWLAPMRSPPRVDPQLATPARQARQCCSDWAIF